MYTLFPLEVEELDVPHVPGLRYLPDYITEDDERTLVALIDGGFWDTRWQRRIQPHGGSYSKEGTEIARTPLPPWGQALADRMLREKITHQPFDHMLVNEYLPGQGIALHADYAPYGRTIVSLSLLSAYVMDFRSKSDGARESLLLQRRSLLVLSDDARYDWEHGIAKRKTDVWRGVRVARGRRLSVTFRHAGDA